MTKPQFKLHEIECHWEAEHGPTRNYWCKDCGSDTNHTEYLLSRVKQLEAALEFYTFENSWIGGGVEGKDGYNDMQGSHAKKILTTMPSEGG